MGLFKSQIDCFPIESVRFIVKRFCKKFLAEDTFLGICSQLTYHFDFSLASDLGFNKKPFQFQYTFMNELFEMGKCANIS